MRSFRNPYLTTSASDPWAPRSPLSKWRQLGGSVRAVTKKEAARSGLFPSYAIALVALVNDGLLARLATFLPNHN
jgi:hypothetical protein